MESEQLTTIRRQLHQIPELGFQEYKTQQYLLDQISSFPQKHLTVKTWRTGVLVYIKGIRPGKTIGYRADIDGLPIKEETGYSFHSRHEGRMHACGHDFHMTIALGVLHRLAEKPPEHNVVMIFQPAEEGPGGALPLLESEEFQQWRPDVIFAQHIAPELPVGTLSTKEGILFANTSELFIDLKGKGGHAAYPHLTRDMVVAASDFVTRLQQIVSRGVDPLDSAVITVGKIVGGTVQNIIAETARLEGTIRTMSPEAMNQVKKQIELLSKGIETGHDCLIHIDYGSNYYQVSNDSTAVAQFKQVASLADVNIIEAPAAMTGEDFGFMLREIPGFMFWLGVDSENGLHHARLSPDEKALPIGVDVVEKTIRNWK
ncbi:N-acetyldiaminopimelate deacetylase [Thalassobacillus pellis]|uniref:N-acetyldiaminopimelate deacetylase n=1 Tax=Thalassobacillus pellis TaxID=748008 RepID=UPI0019608864|nr:N-acetyldiaminopimelate deacetylase [Thalassobacillus pellis]MBM7552942.1 N-acetyldiaminopimelate deacetylase [Thalassobacillus pellis]